MKDLKLNQNTGINLPIGNLISIIGACLVAAWFGFSIIERVNLLEVDTKLIKKDLEGAVEFSIKWPRGELGSLPADSEQFLLIEDALKDIEDICPFDPADGCPAALQDVPTNVTEEVPGCIHQSAENYNPDATEDDGSCTYEEDTPGFGLAVALISIISVAFRRRN